MSKSLSRRRFLRTSAAATVAAAIGTSSRPILGANNELNVAAVGAGGKGSADISGCARENIVALCDVDETQAAKTFAKYPNVPKFKDYRVMLDKMGGEIDAITVTICPRRWR